MAFMHVDDKGWHEGEQKMHALMRTDPYMDNPTSPFLTPGAAQLLQIAPLLAVGALDDDGNPWTTLWGGESGFAQSLGSSIFGIKALVDCRYDPVVQILLGKMQDGEVAEKVGEGRPLSALSIDLSSRRRVKLAGHLLAGALGKPGPDVGGEVAKIGEAQLVVRVDSSLGNCPKYLNKRDIVVSSPAPVSASRSMPLPEGALGLLAKADLFFVTSSDAGAHMSTNHRGGSPGFVRVMSNDADSLVLAYPEYSGNRLYQTLGNLQISPEAGFVFPNFDTGDVLYITGVTEILSHRDAAALMPRSNLVVKVCVKNAHFVQQGLSFRGRQGARSPYNPSVRYLITEKSGINLEANNTSIVNAKLVKREMLTPNIARFRFTISDPSISGHWKPGQYVALSFEDELSAGYSHMRDDDPKSLNDDYVRTFTVSVPPDAPGLQKDEFEIIIRNVGVVTNFLFRQNERAGLEVPLKGFGGDFTIRQQAEELVPVVAGGIGITPLLAQLILLDINRVRLFWTINIRDIGLVNDTFTRSPALATSSILFISGMDSNTTADQTQAFHLVESSGARILKRRISDEDLHLVQGTSEKWYICTGPALKSKILQWLAGKEIIYEDFNY